MLKRLESSWHSFMITVERIYAHHDNALNKINEYQTLKQNQIITIDSQYFTDDILTDQDELEIQLLDSITFGKKNPISYH